MHYLAYVICIGTFLVVTSAHAQVTVEVSQITCAQFVQQKVGPSRLIAAWLSGFYNGKNNNTQIDVQRFQTNLAKVERFCSDQKNFNMSVLQAVERVVGSAR